MNRLTASALHRADACIGSVVLDGIPESGQWAEMGNVADRFVQEATTDREAALGNVPAEWLPMMTALPLEKIPKGAEFQVGFALNALTGEVQRIASRTDGYPDMPPEWMFCSIDITGIRGKRGLVWDLKLGQYTMGRDPETDLQLGMGAVCLWKFCRLDEVEVGFLRADWKGDLHPDTVLLDEWALAEMEERIRGIWQRQQDAPASPPLAVGEHCTYCPARRNCPAQMQPVALALAGRLPELAAATLPTLEEARERIEALTLVDMGRLYERLEAADEYLGMLRGILRDHARTEPLPLSSGKELREVQWGSRKASEAHKAREAALEAEGRASGEIQTIKAAQVRPMKRSAK